MRLVRSSQQHRPDRRWSLYYMCVFAHGTQLVVEYSSKQSSHAKCSLAFGCTGNWTVFPVFLRTTPARTAELQNRLLKIAGSAENGTANEVSLSRTARLVLAAADQSPRFSPTLPSQHNHKSRLLSNSVDSRTGPSVSLHWSLFFFFCCCCSLHLIWIGIKLKSGNPTIFSNLDSFFNLTFCFPRPFS